MEKLREDRIENLKVIGFECDVIGPQDLLVRAIPAIVETMSLDWSPLLEGMLKLSSVEQVIQDIAEKAGVGAPFEQEQAASLIKQLQDEQLWERQGQAGIWREFSLEELLALLR